MLVEGKRERNEIHQECKLSRHELESGYWTPSMILGYGHHFQYNPSSSIVFSHQLMRKYSHRLHFTDEDVGLRAVQWLAQGPTS